MKDKRTKIRDKRIKIKGKNKDKWGAGYSVLGPWFSVLASSTEAFFDHRIRQPVEEVVAEVGCSLQRYKGTKAQRRNGTAVQWRNGKSVNRPHPYRGAGSPELTSL